MGDEEHPATQIISELKAEASKTNADDINVESLYSILDKGKDVLSKPSADEEKHLEIIAKEIIKPDEKEPDKPEKVVKSWIIIFHNSAGKEQQRVLVATSKALYRVRYNFKKNAVENVERCGWENVQLLEYGKFEYSTGLFPSIGQLALKSELNKLYGFRLHYKERPAKATPLPFLIEKYVDQCFRTFRPIPEAKSTDEKKYASQLQAITQEIVFSCIILLRKSGKLSEGPHYIPMSNPSSISICATRGLIAAIHNKAGMGMQKIEAPGAEGSAPAEEKKAE
jgi:hypothetical protein